MSEKSESDEFEDEDEPAVEEGDDDLDEVIKDFDLAKQHRGHKTADPAWRRLERLFEEKHTAELTSDFDDYDLGEGQGPGKPRRKKKG